MTTARWRALEILAKHGPITPGLFAERMWPDNPNWSKVSSVGRGSARGVGMRRAGGGYLGRLRKMGLADVHYKSGVGPFVSYTISAEGKRILRTGRVDKVLTEYALQFRSAESK